MNGPIPSGWLDNVKMQRIVLHWTAGGHKASSFDRQHYHILIEDDGRLVKGVPPISANANPIKPNYAAHTYMLNGGAIGVSLCCMGGNSVRENPFNAGPWPMTREQWDKMVQVIAQLCSHYNIPITPKTVLSHAEVQGTLGIQQAGKWDFTRLAFDPNIKGARAIGDRFREEASSLRNSIPQAFVSEEYDQDQEVAAGAPEKEMEETIQTNREKKEPMSGFRKAVTWFSGSTIGAAVLGFIGDSWSKLAMLDYRIWLGVIFTASLFGTIIFALVWLYPRPIVIEKEKQ